MPGFHALRRTLTPAPESLSLSVTAPKAPKKKLWKVVRNKFTSITGTINIKNRKLLNYSTQGDLSSVLDALSSGADVHATTSQGYTPLYTASARGHVRIVQVLLDRGANINVESNAGSTPFYVACEQGHVDVVKVLIERSADITKSPKSGFHPLHIAAQNGHMEVVLVLLQQQIVDIDTETPVGRLTPLMMASSTGSHEVVQLLLDAQADACKDDVKGNTALHYACELGHYHIVYALLSSRSDPHSPNKAELTPIDIARQYEHLHIVSLLESNNPSLKPIDIMDQAYDFSSVSTSSNDSSVAMATIIMKNRMKYAHYLMLGAIKEEDSLLDDESLESKNIQLKPFAYEAAFFKLQSEESNNSSGLGLERDDLDDLLDGKAEVPLPGLDNIGKNTVEIVK